MFYPIYFLPFINILPFYNIYDRLFLPSFLDSYTLNASFSYPSPSLFSMPSLWRYFATPNLNYWGMSVQDALAQSEYWSNLDKAMRDSYYRTLLTVSAPPSLA